MNGEHHGRIQRGDREFDPPPPGKSQVTVVPHREAIGKCNVLILNLLMGMKFRK